MINSTTANSMSLLLLLLFLVWIFYIIISIVIILQSIITVIIIYIYMEVLNKWRITKTVGLNTKMVQWLGWFGRTAILVNCFIYIYIYTYIQYIYIYIKQLWIQILIVCSDDAFPMMINDAMYTINMNILMQINYPDVSKGLLRLHFTHPGGNGIQKQIPL